MIKKNSEVRSYSETVPIEYDTNLRSTPPNTSQLELHNGFGDKIITLFCSKEFPCFFGEESLILGIRNPYSYLAKTQVVVITFDLRQFFGIFEKTSAKSIETIRKRVADKIKRLTSEVETRVQTEIIKEQKGFNTTVCGSINNVIPQVV